MKINVSKFYLS